MKNKFPKTSLKNTVGAFRVFLLIPVVLLLGSSSVAAQNDFPSVEAFLQGHLKSEDRLNMEVKGDLNADALEDWAGVIERRKSESTTTSQLYVLLRLPGGGFRVAEKSQETENSSSGCCYLENLEISSGSIFIQNNAKSGDYHEAVTHQFKLRQGKWRLIGLKIYEINVSADTTIETSVNLLTGKVIETTQKGERKPTIKNRRRKFAREFLKDFDFSRKTRS